MISRKAVKMAITKPSDVPTLALLYKLNKLTPAAPGTKLPVTLNGSSKLPAPSSSLNDRIGLLRGDITTLAVDAIVNAANKYLLGGSGVDGAIHNAAGPLLLKECQRLGGCDTGSAKITDAYRLPCKKVIHAVGPIYDTLQSDLSESFLDGCYSQSLRLAVENGCKTIAFPSISTGVYGYPSREAAPVALGAVRKFLERDTANAIEKVVFVTFERKDVDAYNEYLP
jgi:O-acetyl-ADP-ribose deacetylase (regulator of RNase III)